jgi:hypothetical protein
MPRNPGCAARPGANGWHPSGMEIERRTRRAHCVALAGLAEILAVRLPGADAARLLAAVPSGLGARFDTAPWRIRLPGVTVRWTFSGNGWGRFPRPVAWAVELDPVGVEMGMRRTVNVCDRYGIVGWVGGAPILGEASGVATRRKRCAWHRDRGLKPTATIVASLRDGRIMHEPGSRPEQSTLESRLCDGGLLRCGERLGGSAQRRRGGYVGRGDGPLDLFGEWIGGIFPGRWPGLSSWAPTEPGWQRGGRRSSSTQGRGWLV